MSSTVVTTPRVLGDVVPGGIARDVALVVGGAAFVGVAAQLSFHVPWTPVPYTGQTFAVLLTAGVLGSVRGVLSMLLYLVVGLAGVPWFAGGTSGTGPSIGYVVGFVAAAAVVGALAERGATRSGLRTAGVMVLGNVVIYAVGVSWLKVSLDVGWGTAITLGMLPFLLGDAIKVAVAAGLFPATWRMVTRRPR